MLYQNQIDALEREVKRLKERLSCGIGLPTTDGAPTGPPVCGKTVVYDPATGIIYYWDGADWQTIADTNSFNTNLVQDANRALNAAGFDRVITGLGDYTVTVEEDGKTIRLFNTYGTEGSFIEIDKNKITLYADTGLAISSVTIDPATGITLFDSNGNYFIGDAFGFAADPPIDNTVNHAFVLDTSDSDRVKLRPLNNLAIDQIGITIDPGGVISTGYKGRFYIPYDCLIVGWTLLEISENPIVSNTVVDVNICDYPDYNAAPVFVSIAGSEKPTLSGTVTAQDSALATWTTLIQADTVFEYEVDSNDVAEKLLLSIKVIKA